MSATTHNRQPDFKIKSGSSSTKRLASAKKGEGSSSMAQLKKLVAAAAAHEAEKQKLQQLKSSTPQTIGQINKNRYISIKNHLNETLPKRNKENPVHQVPKVNRGQVAGINGANST